MDHTTPPPVGQPAPGAGDEPAGIGEELGAAVAETIAEIREESRWVMANLRELASVFGFGPDRPAAD